MTRVRNLVALFVLIVIVALTMSTIQAMQTMAPGAAKAASDLSEDDISSALMAVEIDPDYSHAIEEHPEDAPIVRDCLATKGAYMSFQVIPGKRYLRVCIVDADKGLVGFQIVDLFGRVAKERTAYIKESIKNIRDLLKYTQRMGYPRFRGPL